MDRNPPSYHLDILSDRSSLRDVLKGILHTIFFHRYFTPLYPSTHEILDLTLPYITEDNLDTQIETKITTLLRSLDSKPPRSTSHTSTITIHFLERKRKKSSWFITKADEETVWESWILNISLLPPSSSSSFEGIRGRKATEKDLKKNVMKVLQVCNKERGHIPPITTNESNPFPWQILVNSGNSQSGGVGGKMGIF